MKQKVSNDQMCGSKRMEKTRGFWMGRGNQKLKTVTSTILALGMVLQFTSFQAPTIAFAQGKEEGARPLITTAQNPEVSSSLSMDGGTKSTYFEQGLKEVAKRPFRAGSNTSQLGGVSQPLTQGFSGNSIQNSSQNPNHGSNQEFGQKSNQESNQGSSPFFGQGLNLDKAFDLSSEGSFTYLNDEYLKDLQDKNQSLNEVQAGNKGLTLEPMVHDNLIPAIVLDNIYTTYVLDTTLNYDVYISPDCLLSVRSNGVIKGNVYNYGVIELLKEMTADHVYAGDYYNYKEGDLIYNGDILNRGGSIKALGIYSILDIPSLPFHVYSPRVVNSDLRLPLLEGAVLPLFSLYLESLPVSLFDNGSFTIYDYYVGSKTSLQFDVKDYFGTLYPYRLDLSQATPKSLISIKVTKVPDKTVYRQGEPLDLRGLEVTGFYDDGSETLLPVIQEHISGHSMMEVDPARVLTVTFEGLKAYFTIRVDPMPSVGLIAGYNRFETAAMVAEASYDVTDTAVIVQARNFPDALAAGPLAAALNAPILLTDTKALEYYTPDTLHQLRVKKVILMGGELVISKAVEDELKKTYQVERIAGATRYDTALKAAEYLNTLKGTPQSAVITSGTSFADALSAGSYAAINGFPMILTDGKTLTAANTSYLKNNQITRVTILGGQTIISASIENQLIEQGIEVERIFGTTRVDTSAKFAQRYFPECNTAIAANGWTFADALSAIPYAAKQNAPILLVRQNYVDQVMTTYLKDSAIHLVTVIGGDQVVSEKVRHDLWLAIQ